MRAKEADLQVVRINQDPLQQDPLQQDIKYQNRLVAKIKQQEKEYIVHLFYYDDTVVQKASQVDSYPAAIDLILDWLREPVCNLIHISDNHSTLPKLPGDADEMVVCSGDFFPNSTRGVVEVEETYQTQWLIENLPAIKKWIGGRTFIFCDGNHDFIDPCEILQREGVRAISITNRLKQHNGITFYGFPYIPWIGGEWNYECHVPDMINQVAKLKLALSRGVDVLVAHCPPYGILDANFVIRDGTRLVVPGWAEHCGNRILTNLLSYELDNIPKELRPKYLLCGHIHESHSIMEEFGMTISNAATIVRLIEIKL